MSRTTTTTDTTPHAPRLQCHVRWMIRADQESVLRIERAAFPQFSWTEEDFIRKLRQRHCIGMTVETPFAGSLKIVGYMVYELHTRHITLLNLAVDPRFARRGVGTAMIDKLKDKLAVHQYRRSIGGEVRETNLDALNFLKSQGFRAAGLLKKYYVEAGMFGEDAIVMRYRMPAIPLSPINRIS
jgi:ribosomal-protein-alanine N-acetyltransferase